MRIHLVRSSDVGRDLLASIYNLLVQEDGPVQFLKEEHSVSFQGQQTALSWEMIFDKCTEYRTRYTIPSDEFIILLTSKRNKENWFASPDPKGTRSIFIHTSEWDHYRALPRIRFHDLRHAHATHLLSSGVHPKVASERLGHSKVGITLDLYSHVLPNMQADAAAIVDDALRAVLNKRGTQGVAKD